MRAPAPPHHQPRTAKEASCRFKSAVLKQPHLNAVAAAQEPNSNNNVHHVDLEACRREDEDRAFQAVKSMEKHQNQNQKKQKHKHHEYEAYDNHKGQFGKQTSQGSSRRHQRQSSASKSTPIEERTIRGYDRRMIDDTLTNVSTSKSKRSPERDESRRDSKAVSLLHGQRFKSISILTTASPTNQSTPSGHQSSTSSSLKARPTNPAPSLATGKRTLASSAQTST